ncbi:helix-turn-helix transcriptional regulator [Agromyces sp. LHK192]|uniref:helix-turn-helix transcriptional regulator n=1 Tax=Agromyces sp. LHK192 TaxID=2498704 RepID=UPI000FD6FD89|nr:helix-turn-helix transcriptional regulator [Agromyces sp. LHK192]
MQSIAPSSPRLTDRHRERARLERLIADARDGTSGAVVVRGMPGIGKTAMLDHVRASAAGCRVLRSGAVESEMELAFSGLHQLCAPLLGDLARLPEPQQQALGTAFGIREGPPADKFLVGLATLNLLAESASAQPLVCLIDDAQWLDRVSAQVLGFVARRLGSESVVLVFAARDGEDLPELVGPPELALPPLDDHDARRLLAAAIRGGLDASVRDRIVAEARGNPLALLELPRAWSTDAIAGGFGLPDSVTVPERVAESYRHRIELLPDDSRMLLLVAAAEPVGDPALIRDAADRLGLSHDADLPATAAGLLDERGELGFRHPLVRSVVYRAAATGDRRRVHAALAAATDASAEPDRRAWHLAAATSGPDEEVASVLERSSDRAQARGGVSAAAAFLRRSAMLSPDPASRTARMLAAAQLSVQAGSFAEALHLLDRAERGSLDAVQQVTADLLRGEIAFAAGYGDEAPPLLADAAGRMAGIDVERGRQTYLIAWVATVFAGAHADPEALPRLCRAILELPGSPADPSPLELLLDGLASLMLDGPEQAAPVLRRAARVLPALGVADVLRWGWAATAATDATWDPDGTFVIAERQNAVLRRLGALGQLSLPLAALGNHAIWTGDLAGAESIVAEATSVAAAVGSRFPPTVELRLLAARGDRRAAEALIESTMTAARTEGQGMAAANADWATAVLDNGLGRYEDALSAAQRATAATNEPFVSMWALPELIEAAARSGRPDLAREALDRLRRSTRPCGTDPALGIEARCRALLGEGAAAAEDHREAVERLARTSLRPELARAHLLAGEWSRREGRRAEARAHLRTAHDLFANIGMAGFAERARRELVATGEHPRRRGDASREALTPQEEQIARLARDGHSNHEISAQLFLSPRTVEWHLRKVFAKLGISSRHDLPRTLGAQSPTTSTTLPGPERRAPPP